VPAKPPKRLLPLPMIEMEGRANYQGMTISHKYYPYIFISIICVVAAGFGYIIIPTMPWYIHVFATVARFVCISAIWQLIVQVNRKLEKRFTLEQRPGTQIFLQVLVTLLLLSPVFIFSMAWSKPILWAINTRNMLAFLSIVFIITILMMTFGYYTYDLFLKYKRSSEEKSRLALETAQLEKERSMMRYHHLKNQVNPHFLFNTLTSLDGLIQLNPALASDFIRHLSKVYRYVLEHKENEVVSVETEVSFIQHYISLLQIRYKEALDIKLNISETALEKGIVMVTLQMLIDNAIKHNSVQAGQPLQICISNEGDWLCIGNNKQLRKQIETSNGHGLKQLQELYAFLTEKPVLIKDTENKFEVKLPLL
jgi:two-component system LytT family sensor kinase